MDEHINNNEDRKAEILARIRQAKKDEGMENADYRGTKIGVIVFAVVALFLAIGSVPDRMYIVHAIASLSFAWVVGGTISYYRFTKRKSFLVCVVASAIASVAFAIMAVFL